jgi:hypothetical protein
VSQIDGEPAWHGKTYNALKDKKHLTGINKEEVRIFQNLAGHKANLKLSPTNFAFDKSKGLIIVDRSHQSLFLNKSRRSLSAPPFLDCTCGGGRGGQKVLPQ